MKAEIGGGNKQVGYTKRQEQRDGRAVGGLDSRCAGLTRKCEASRGARLVRMLNVEEVSMVNRS